LSTWHQVNLPSHSNQPTLQNCKLNTNGSWCGQLGGLGKYDDRSFQTWPVQAHQLPRINSYWHFAMKVLRKVHLDWGCYVQYIRIALAVRLYKILLIPLMHHVTCSRLSLVYISKEFFKIIFYINFVKQCKNYPK